MLRFLAVKTIRIYQKTISPDHGILRGFFPDGFCRFHPSCSEYTARAIVSRGVFVGGTLGAWRICRCNPWSKGGYDPPPEPKTKKNAKQKK